MNWELVKNGKSVILCPFSISSFKQPHDLATFRCIFSKIVRDECQNSPVWLTA